MKIGIIGAGFTGLAAAYQLSKSGHQVTIFEKEDRPGGLAIGFSDTHWDWPLEKHYHHLFTSDWSIRNLARDINFPIDFSRPITSMLTSTGIYQLDSPLHLLKFPDIPFFDRIRVGAVLAYLRLTPFWQPLEKVTAQKFLTTSMGDSAWKILWQPLFSGKFSRRLSDISMAWFWARIKKRSPTLGYPRGGFENLARAIAQACTKSGAVFHYQTGITSIKRAGEKLEITTDSATSVSFDRVICTLPNPLFVKIVPDLPPDYQHRLTGLEGIGAVNLVLSLSQKFLPGGAYWLNINRPGLPFLAVVEHTNFISSSKYSGANLLYVGNYLPPNHRYFSFSEKQLIAEFTAGLQSISPKFKPSWVKKAWVWKAPFAQPIVTVNYSRKIPDLKTPVSGLFLANIQQVYPWDRGTNYAVELGNRVADICTQT